MIPSVGAASPSPNASRPTNIRACSEGRGMFVPRTVPGSIAGTSTRTKCSHGSSPLTGRVASVSTAPVAPATSSVRHRRWAR